MRVISLGSGSSGNALLVRAGAATVLVDAGFGMRILLGRLQQVGVAPSAVTAIFLTHEHADHACGAAALSRRYGIPIIADPRTLRAILAHDAARGEDSGAITLEELPIGRAKQLDTLEVRGFPISHDAVAPCGYVLASSAWRVCVVTDTGMATEPMIEAMTSAHLLVLEANHDRARLLNGPYPQHLKQRILGPTGHLSNEQTCQALERALDDGPRWLWLAHLSKTNNTPDLARTHIREHLRTLGLRHIAPVPLPREGGPVWDSAALWGAAPRPVAAPLP